MPWNDANTRLDQATLSLKWCIHLTDALVRQGVRQAFISPGSRSTPLTLALVHHPGIRCHSVLDERSAAFMALGAGKICNETGTQTESDRQFRTNTPALFVCTSGTAVANAFPAVVEARMSATPLLMLTADRPPNLRATGASQTIDQTKIFGDYPVFFFDTGEPVDTPEDFRRLDRLGVQAVTLSRIKKGPVHLNLPFRKPLEPSNEQIHHVLNTGERKTRVRPDFVANESIRVLPKTLSDLISESQRPLVVAGSGFGYADSFFEWCRKYHVPVLAETGGIAGAIFRHPLIMQDADRMKSLEPDLVLRVGGDPVHRPTLETLQKLRVPQILFGDHPDLPDASVSGTHLISGEAGDYNWADLTLKPDTFTAYFEQWHNANRQAVEKQRKSLEAESGLTDLHIYHHLLPYIAESNGSRVVVSNSFPIRDYLLYGPEQAISKLPLLVNRGASGIDGMTSTAIGLALASEQPTVLFTGDLAFLHDTGALNNLNSRNIKLKIVVINNRGGSIFRMLPFDKHDAIFTEFFETPQQVAMADLARAHGLPFESVETTDSLPEAWERLKKHSTGVLECRTDPGISINLRHNL